MSVTPHTILKPLAVEIEDLHKYVQDPSEWVITEKIDGIRFRYLPSQRLLISSRGNTIHAPRSFTAMWPSALPWPLEGELHLHDHRGPFEKVSSFARKQTPVQAEWDQLTASVFDAVMPGEPFLKRWAFLRELQGHPHTVPLYTCTNRQELDACFKYVVDRGGEGLCLHHIANTTRTRKSALFIKVKPAHFLEAVVVGHQPGTGRLANMTGALLCEYEGQRIKVGSGLDDALRASPPPIGTRIKVRYRGLTKNGRPRFPTFKGTLPKPSP